LNFIETLWVLAGMTDFRFNAGGRLIISKEEANQHNLVRLARGISARQLRGHRISGRSLPGRQPVALFKAVWREQVEAVRFVPVYRYPDPSRPIVPNETREDLSHLIGPEKKTGGRVH
jgi:hypothetical protein